MASDWKNLAEEIGGGDVVIAEGEGTCLIKGILDMH